MLLSLFLVACEGSAPVAQPPAPPPATPAPASPAAPAAAACEPGDLCGPPLGEGPWTVRWRVSPQSDFAAAGRLHAYDDDAIRSNGWDVYAERLKDGWHWLGGGTDEWEVSVVDPAESVLSCTGSGYQACGKLRFKKDTAAGRLPAEWLLEPPTPVATAGYHANGRYTVTAHLSDPTDESTVTADVEGLLWVAGSGATRTEWLCAQSGFAYPGRDGDGADTGDRKVTWTIHGWTNEAFPSGGCPTRYGAPNSYAKYTISGVE